MKKSELMNICKKLQKLSEETYDKCCEANDANEPIKEKFWENASLTFDNAVYCINHIIDIIDL